MKNTDTTDESVGNLPSLSLSEESSHNDENTSTEAVNGKNHFLENASQVIQRKFQEAQEYEEDHHILEKIKEFTEETYRNVAQWADEHRVVERSKTMASKGTAFAMSKIRECVKPSMAIDVEPEPEARTEQV